MTHPWILALQHSFFGLAPIAFSHTHDEALHAHEEQVRELAQQAETENDLAHPIKKVA